VKVLVQLQCLGIHENASLKSNHGLQQDFHSISGPGKRVATAMGEFVQHECSRQISERTVRISNGDFSDDPMSLGWVTLTHAIRFRRCIENITLEQSPKLLAQLRGIGGVYAQRLWSHGARTFKDVMSASNEVIEQLCERRTPFAINLKSQIACSVPQYEVQVQQIGYLTDTQQARVQVSVSEVQQRISSPAQYYAHIIVGDLRDQLVLYRKMRLNELPFRQTLDVNLGIQLKVTVLDDKTGQLMTKS
jgi:hypothetical protein